MYRLSRLSAHLSAASEGAFPLPGASLDALREACADLRVDGASVSSHGRERSGHAPFSAPCAVAYPRSVGEVQALMRVCNRLRIPVTPYAGGTSLEGHAVPSRGALSLDLSRMNALVAVNEQDEDCVVGPGMNWVDLNRELRPKGLFLGVDPSPAALIGGTKALRYGTMAAQVLSLLVVTADGTLVRTGRRARKSSAGYDMTRLFVGSEGTLGVVVEATLRLRRLPERTAVARVGFATVRDAARAVAEVTRSGVDLAAAELLCETMVAAVNAKHAKRLGGALPEVPTVLFKFAGPAAHVDLDIERAREACAPLASGPFVFSRTDAEAERLWTARKLCLFAAKSRRPGRSLMTTDVCVPVSRAADVIMAAKAEIDSSPLYAPVVAHAGDGNFHAFIMFDPSDAAETREAHRLHAAMVRLALDADGTCTGEHGVGSGKKRFLVEEVGPEAVELMRKIKRALDPNGILNPGKVFDL